jgi:hypothetical protein
MFVPPQVEDGTGLGQTHQSEWAVGTMDSESTAATKLVAYTTIWAAAVQCSVISAEGTVHFVAYATIFEAAFQIQ